MDQYKMYQYDGQSIGTKPIDSNHASKPVPSSNGFSRDLFLKGTDDTQGHM